MILNQISGLRPLNFTVGSHTIPLLYCYEGYESIKKAILCYTYCDDDSRPVSRPFVFYDNVQRSTSTMWFGKNSRYLVLSTLPYKRRM